MKKTYAVLAIAAIAVLVIYFCLPDRNFSESVFPVPEGATFDKYDDRSDGGMSEVALSVKDSSAFFSCSLGADTAGPAWCGLLWNFDPKGEKDYRNWTFVDTIFLDVKAAGTKQVLLKVWTFDPDVTDLEKQQTFKLLMKEVPLEPGKRQTVAIPMEELYTPEFWYGNAGVDPKFNKRHQESVARVEIAPGWEQARGTAFALEIYGIHASGVSNFYFGIVLFAFLGFTIVAVGLRHKDHGDEDKD
ncbi:MAG: CIA30 family protein [Fibrobacter sp.]|jgi:hypothetical protein|nr:CIA30 family protein [Fibrobacter sp.]